MAYRKLIKRYISQFTEYKPIGYLIRLVVSCQLMFYACNKIVAHKTINVTYATSATVVVNETFNCILL